MIYAIDFDGTIVENKFPAIGELKLEAESFIRALQERGDKWILYTMREGKVLREALAFLMERGLVPDAVNDNLPEMCDFYRNNPRKVFANVYIDDHNAGGLLFSGPQIESEIKGCKGEKHILDACCGSRMFWFDRSNPAVWFVDNRNFECQAIWKSTKNNATRYCSVHPDIVADFRSLPFPSDYFWHIVFDPPHLFRSGETAWLTKKYGKLPADWEHYLHDGFTECWRVLRPCGTLIFKWCEHDIPVERVLAAIGRRPLYGHRSGKRARTHWMAFVKVPEVGK